MSINAFPLLILIISTISLSLDAHRSHRRVAKEDAAEEIEQPFDSEDDSLLENEEETRGEAVSSDQPFFVRICLATLAENDEAMFKITGNGLLLSSANGKQQQKLETSELEVMYCDGQIFINGKKLSVPAVKIISEHESLTFCGNSYPGTFMLLIHEGRLYLINADVDLEEYVAGVVQAESWPGWPLEVNKGFSIVCRSYLLAQILQKRALKKKIFFDIGSTNAHQTYKGKSCSQAVLEAVSSTKGVVLTYDKKPIMAMYDACCGGVIPAKIHGVDFKKAPYLARPYACSSCSECKIFSWSVSYDAATLGALLMGGKKKKPSKNSPLEEVKILSRDPAGLVERVRLVLGKKLSQNKTGKELYSALKDLKSFCFSVEKKGKKFTFKGRGYGHHMGLCQWGMRQLVRDGWNFRRILKFYYPNTTFMKISVKTKES